jgi:hypothetical protein
MNSQNPAPGSAVPPELPDPVATSPRLPQCPRHGYDKAGAECYGDAGCPEWEQCADCFGTGRDRDFPRYACATCEGSGEIEVIVAVGHLVPRVVDVELPLLLDGWTPPAGGGRFA